MREPIRTERLLLRDITEADAEALVDLDSDPEVMRHLGSYGGWDLAQYRDRIRTAYLPLLEHAWQGMHIVEDREQRRFLGWVFARAASAAGYAQEMGWHRSDEIEIGYRFQRRAWGRGIATEASLPLVERGLADPEITAIVSCAAQSNLGSLRVLEKLGLKRIGAVPMPGFDVPLIQFRREAATQ